MSFRYTLFLVLPKSKFIYEEREVEFSIPLAIGMTINVAFDVAFEREGPELCEHILEVAGIHCDQRTGGFSAQLLVPLGASTSEVRHTVVSANGWRSWELGHEPRGFPLSWLPKKKLSWLVSA